MTRKREQKKLTEVRFRKLALELLQRWTEVARVLSEITIALDPPRVVPARKQSKKKNKKRGSRSGKRSVG